MPRLAWLIPPPRQHQIRYAGVLAPAAFLRSAIVPTGRISVQGALFPTNRRAFEPLTHALDVVLPDLEAPTKEALEAKMKGHVLAKTELVGGYTALKNRK